MNWLFVRIAKWVKMGRYEKPLFVFKLQNDTPYPLTWIRRIDQILPNLKAPIRHLAPLPPREQRHPFLRYQGLEYTDADIADFEERMVMEHRDDAGVVVFTSRAWGRLFGTRGPLVWELIMEFLSTLRFGEVLLDLDAPELHTEEEMESLVLLDFLGPPTSYNLIRDPVLRLYHRIMAHIIAGRSQAPEKVTVTDLFYLRELDVRSFVAQLAEHFGLLTAEILGGLMVIAPELLIIGMGELVRLQICIEVDDTWAWVAMGPERQPDVAAGAPGVAQDAPIVDEGGQADPAPVQAPPPPPAAARTMPQRMARLEEDVHEIRRTLAEQREVLIFLRIYHGPRERNIDEYWWRIYKSGDLEVLES
ncbi:hypothetical protein Tco_1068843 [Tanacetum coccineum]|uniref:Uncharacterized protein n=1 Tax=Tanacetum coccineum TaxID=301880 RepID=A0ABQ5HH26_9ASTR